MRHAHINDTVNCGLNACQMPMPSEREELVQDIKGLKESISLAWMDMISKPMTAAERAELRNSIDSLVKELDSLQSKLGRLPKTQT